MKLNQLIATLILSLLVNVTIAQDSSQKKPVFSATVAYQSYVHFLGRSDSVSTAAALPIISYQLKNGLYAQGAAVFIHNAVLPFQLAGGSIETGYRFPENDHFSGNIFASKFIYKDQSTLPQSVLKYQTGINTSIKTKPVNFNLAGDLKFSNQTDIGLTGGLDHLFIIPVKKGEAKAVALNPTYTAYAGTQRFIMQYEEKQQNIGGIPIGNSQMREEQVNRISLLAHEFTMPVVLVINKFNAFISPSYVVPVNLINSNGEYGRNKFYVTAGIGIRL
jgi:hypothetical protein